MLTAGWDWSCSLIKHATLKILWMTHKLLWIVILLSRSRCAEKSGSEKVNYLQFFLNYCIAESGPFGPPCFIIFVILSFCDVQISYLYRNSIARSNLNTSDLNYILSYAWWAKWTTNRSQHSYLTPLLTQRRQAVYVSNQKKLFVLSI